LYFIELSNRRIRTLTVADGRLWRRRELSCNCPWRCCNILCLRTRGWSWS